tara:strand:- start:898 stop:1443 length:546 start_codon:yes stop_codon:yes gene_type:complete
MKIGRHLNMKEYVWKSLNKLTNNFTKLTVNNLADGYIKCFWELSSIDNFRIEFSKSGFCALRLFDITNNRNNKHSTCIMKEIQVNKFQSSIIFPIPINKGVYYFEFGFRQKNGQWRKLAHQKLNLGYRIKRIMQNFDNDNWFDSKKFIINNDLSFHEKAYQLSLNPTIGGSEKIHDEKENA